MSVVMPRTARAMPDNSALVRVLEASVEILKTENEILNRRLAAAETRAAQAVITKRLDALAASRLEAGARRPSRAAHCSAGGSAGKRRSDDGVREAHTLR